MDSASVNNPAEPLAFDYFKDQVKCRPKLRLMSTGTLSGGRFFRTALSPLAPTRKRISFVGVDKRKRFTAE